MTESKTKKGKTVDKIVFSIRVSPRFHHAFRLEALKKKITMLELLELYQTAYDEKVEQEKAEKRAEREGKRCKSCEQLILT